MLAALKPVSVIKKITDMITSETRTSVSVKPFFIVSPRVDSNFIIISFSSLKQNFDLN